MPSFGALKGSSVMNTPRNNSFLPTILDGDVIPLGTLSYFRERFRDRLYDLIMEEFLEQAAEAGLTRAEVARRIGRRPEQITRWFSAPGNWTLETVSDLLLAIAKSEPDVTVMPLEGRAVPTCRHQHSSVQRADVPPSDQQPRSVVEENQASVGFNLGARTLGDDQPRLSGPSTTLREQGD